MKFNKEKNKVLIVVVMSISTHITNREEKKFQERFDNFKEQIAQETESLNNSQSIHV